MGKSKKQTNAPMQWCSIDLHVHTPASSDYQQAEVTILDILRRAETRGLAIIAITDHNTVAGYRHLVEDVHQLELLAELGRILPEEGVRLCRIPPAAGENPDLAWGGIYGDLRVPHPGNILAGEAVAGD